MSRDGKRTRSLIRTSGLFIASAACCFSLFQATVAHSKYWTIDAVNSCNGASGSTASPRLCALIQRTGSFPISSLTAACASFLLYGGVTYTNTIVKQSYTGSLYQDWNTFQQALPSNNTLCVGAGNVLTAASQYDYLYFKEASSDGSPVNMRTVTVTNSVP